MATRSLGTLTIDILARTANLTQGMSKAAREVDNEAQKIKRSLEQNVGGATKSAGDYFESMAKRVAGISAIVGSLGFVVRETMRAEAAQAQLGAVLKSTGEAAGLSSQELNDMAKAMSRASIFDVTSITEAQTRLLSYSGIIGENIPRAMQAVIDQSARLGISLTQSAEIIGRALESPSKAAAALAQQGFGAAFTKEVRATIDALVASGKEAEAQIMILEILEESYAGAAEAARGTLGGALAGLRNAFSDLVSPAGESSEAIKLIAAAINSVSENLPAVVAGMAGIASSQVSKALIARVAVIRETNAQLIAQTKAELANAQALELKTRAALLDAQAEVRRAQAIGGSVAISAKAAQATLAHRQAVLALEAAQARAAAAANVWGRAAGSLLGFFGGPAGIAVMLATTAASWLLFRDNTDKSTQALIDFNGTADESIRKFEELNRAQQAGEMLRLSDEIAEGVKSIGESIALLSNEADFTDLYDTFGESLRKLQREFESGKINADEFANAVSDLGNKLIDTGQVEEVQRRGIINYAAAIGNAAREVERKNQILDAFAGKQRDAANAVDGNTQAIREQAAALAQGQKALSDYIGRMDQIVNRGIVEIVRKTKGEFAALQVEVGQLINAAGGVEALTPEQRAAINAFLAARRRQIQLEQEYEAQRKAARGGRGGKSDAEREAEQLQRDYESMMESMRKRIALFGQEGEAARVRYEIEQGSLKALDDAKKQALLTEAQRIDQMERMAELQEAADRAARAEYERIQEGLKYGKELLADLQFELELMRMTNAERATAIQLRGMEAEAIAEYGEAIARANRDIEESMKLVRLMDDMRGEFRNFFEDIISGAESVGDAFKNLINGIADAITRFVSQRLVEQLFGGFGTLQGGSTGWISAIAGLFGGRRASGGWTSPNTMYEVNERGIEMATVRGRDYLLTGNSPVEITPNHRLGFGGTSVVNNFAFAAPTSPKTQSQVAARVGYEIRRAQRLGI